jgi:integrase
LQWKDVDLSASLLEIRHSKTPAGWRTPTLNTVCSEALASLYQNAQAVGVAEPDHYVFPTDWRSAWRSILREAGIKARFHDLRHTAVTRGSPQKYSNRLASPDLESPGVNRWVTSQSMSQKTKATNDGGLFLSNCGRGERI